MLIKEYKIEQVKYPEYEKFWPGRYPYQHQAALFDQWNEQRNFLVTTKTGSGKTVAAAFPIIVNKESAVFLYPTNALIEDQEKSIKEMLHSLNMPHYTYKAGEEFNQLQYQQAEVLLLRIDADNLEELRRQYNKKSKGRALKELLSERKPMLIFTNPDTLFYILAFFYGHSGELLGYLQRFSTLVIDEFHLYAGIELNHILFMLEYLRFLGAFKRMILLSATSDPEVKKLLYCLISPVEISSSTKTLFPVVNRKPAIKEITLYTNKEAGSLIEQAIKITKKILPDLSINPPKEKEVPLVVIFNSVLDAIGFEDLLIRELGLPVESIGSYRGLVGKKVRSVNRKLIVVGTSAIEVGVDFNCRYLIFEAADSASFIQRIGRAGRHQPGFAYLIYNREQGQEADAFSSLPVTIEREDFEKKIYSFYEGRDSFAWFVKTECAIIAIKALVYRLLQSLIKSNQATQEQKLYIQNKVAEILESYAEKIGATPLLKKVNRYFERLELLTWLQAYLGSMSFRASSMNIPVYDLREKNIGREAGASYEADLKKVLVRGKIKAYMYDPQKGFKIIIDGYMESKKISIMVNVREVGGFHSTGEVPDILFLAGNTAIVELSGFFNQQEQLFFVASEKIEPYLDWRIGCFRCNKGYIGFGANALLLKEFCRKYIES